MPEKDKMTGRFHAMSNEMFVNRLKERNPKVIPLEEYINANTKMLFGCADFPEHKWRALPSSVNHGSGCPFCAVEKLKRPKPERYIRTVRPDLVGYLKNEEDADNYNMCYSGKLTWVCHQCGNEYDRSPVMIKQYGLKCPYCNLHGISYPQRFIQEVFKQLEYPFIAEYSPSWLGKQRFDLYFSIGDKEYAIEMDGAFHKKRDVGTLKTRYEERKERDSRKDKLAKEHNIRMIRIDSCYSHLNTRVEYLRQNILSSELKEFFNLSEIDFDVCDKKATEEILPQIAKFWEEYKDAKKIASIMNLSKDTVMDYLKLTEKYGMSSFSIEEIKLQKNRHNGEVAKSFHSHPIVCLETGEIFPSSVEAAERYKTSPGNIRGVVRYKKTKTGTPHYHAGKLPDGTPLTWEEIERR